MKKQLLLMGAMAILASPMVAGAAGFEPGLYRANLNVNVRSTPAFGRNLINHFPKDSVLQVIGTSGGWCQIKAERRSFVYCGNLSRTVTLYTEPMEMIVTGSMINMPYYGAGAESLNGSLGTAVKSLELQTVSGSSSYVADPNDVLAVRNLKELKSYLKDNQEKGKNYINKSLDKGMATATAWAADAYLVKFEAQFPLNGKDNESNCSFVWASKTKNTELLKTLCLNNETSLEATGMKLVSDLNLAGNGAVNPELKWSDLVSQMVENKDLLKRLTDTFSSTPVASVNWSFVLSNVSAGNPIWTVTLMDNAGNVKFKATTPANKATANLSY